MYTNVSACLLLIDPTYNCKKNSNAFCSVAACVCTRMRVYRLERMDLVFVLSSEPHECRNRHERQQGQWRIDTRGDALIMASSRVGGYVSRYEDILALLRH
mmetsp:Transcript_39384/g.98533  ORF Transcript_39384/g.98533 Transcript_39384/m.98533 type:complete len:101 (-) Transcript_39384:1834-2136(-)